MILKTKGSGRLAGHVKANPNAAFAFGGYINSDVIGFGLCDVTGRVIESYEIPFADAETPKKALDFFFESHKKLLSYVENKTSLGTSIAIVGPMDKTQNLIVNPPDMPKWGVVPFKTMYEKAISSPMIPELFTEAILLGDLLFGDRDISQNIILFWLDEGIGASISQKGYMDLELKDKSTILGHQIVDFNGVPCHCGKRGCLINYGSIHSFRQTLLPKCHFSREEQQRAKKLHDENPWGYSTDLELVQNAASKKERSFMIDTFLDDFDKAYFAGLWNTLNGIRPNKIIFCGRIALYYKDRIQKIVSRVMTNSHFETQDRDTDVYWINLDSNSLIRGSAARVFNHYLSFAE